MFKIHNKVVLLHSDFDLLYYGVNEQNNFILFSFLKEKEDIGCIEYIATILSKPQLFCFLNNNTSYLNLLKGVSNMYKVQINYAGNIISSETINFSNLSESELPDESFYCPQNNK